MNENLIGCVWLIPELMVLNSGRKGGFGPRVEGPLTGPETHGTLPTASNRAIKQLPGNAERERGREMDYGTDKYKNGGKDLHYVECEDGVKG